MATPPVTAPGDRTPPSLEVAAAPDTIRERGGQCPGPYTSTVTADADDGSGVVAVRFRWPGADGDEVRLLREAPSEVTVGPYPSGSHDATTTVPVEVEVFDRTGNVAADEVEIVVQPAATCLG